MDDHKQKVDRRKFMTGAAVAGAAVATPGADTTKGAAQAAIRPPVALRPTAQEMNLEFAALSGPAATYPGKPGSDFMVDVLRTLNIDYIATNPASSCRGIHESIINYNPGQKPELLTVMHEETGAGMAHGYAKVTGKPMALLFHGTVGIMHASMAVYNAWCDRVPMLIFAGNHTDAADRLPGVPTTHAAQDPLLMIRDFTKWDDQPVSLQHYAESVVRAYKISMTAPQEPVCISLDGHLQDHPIPEGVKLSIPKYVPTSQPAGDPNAVREAARMLAEAQNPVIVVDRAARTAKGQTLLIELAETLNASVVDLFGRQNFPNRHPLNQTERSRVVIGQADVIIGLEVNDFWNVMNSMTDNIESTQSRRAKADAKTITISTQDLYIRGNYQDFQRFQVADIPIAADTEVTLPMLIEEVKRALTTEQKAAGVKRADDLKKANLQTRERLMQAAAIAWDAQPISTARLSAEVWAVIKDENWGMVSRDSSLSNWPHRLWNFNKYHQFIGGSGGAGVGYGLPAAVGGALGHKAMGNGVIPINFQNDGDAMFAPGALWTACHHNIPILNIMHNNRAYHQEVMHVQRMGNRRNRGVENAHIGTVIDRPFVDFAGLAKSMGMTGIGPITSPNDLGPALKRAVAMVKAKEPVLLDVITQPR